MRRVTRIVLGVVGLAVAVGPALAEDGLQVGDEAPAFSLMGSDGKTHTLAEHAGKRVVVVAWFPKAFTSG